MAATRVLATLLYGVSPTDPLTLVVVSATLLAVAAMAVTVGAVLVMGAAITMWTIEGTEVLNAFQDLFEPQMFNRRRVGKLIPGARCRHRGQEPSAQRIRCNRRLGC